MKSDFDKEKSIGLYTFDKQDVFEALSFWCAKKGINLQDKQILSFDCSGDPYFVVELEFISKKQGEAVATPT